MQPLTRDLVEVNSLAMLPLPSLVTGLLMTIIEFGCLSPKREFFVDRQVGRNDASHRLPLLINT